MPPPGWLPLDKDALKRTEGVRKEGRVCGLSQSLATAFHTNLISLMPMEVGLVVPIPPRPGSLCVGCGGESVVVSTLKWILLGWRQSCRKVGKWGELYQLALPEAGVWLHPGEGSG